jgi:hypothetical protein
MNKFIFVTKVTALFAILSLTSTAQADSVALTESQKDVVKCGPVTRDPDTGEKSQVCDQVTSGSYAVTAKLSATTFEDNGVYLADITPDTQFGISIGTFTFSGSLSTANKNKLTQTGLQGSWIDQHEGCSKYDADDVCIKPKQVTDGTVKISASLKGATIILSGKSDNDSNGQKIYASLCESNGTGTTTESASVTIGSITIPWPINITCKVKPSTKDPDGLKGGPFELTNMTIKAKLSPVAY